ncbi:hypothetical protein MKX03_019210 [Papaver bracteatum]|nr:hypothetical protein MKX03_013079 [Papaver bracteatum]KAI3898491.1 hypothetical protein MKX03_019210 [Papaver bracteatum]
MANKNRKIETAHGVDHISTLPDDVLIRILSLVPTEQAVLTSLLSKRWKFLWTSMPELDFDYDRFWQKFDALNLDDDDDDDIKRRFLDFVQHVFSLHELEPLQNLRLAFDIDVFDDYMFEASMLVRFAMRSNCLTIDLELSDSSLYAEDSEYTLPPCFFPHRSVSQLKLTGCKFIPSLYRSFTSVNVVKLTHVELQKDSVYDLVSKCSRLEELHLIRCKIPSSFFELNAPESDLKCLVLQSCLGNGGFGFEHASIHIPTLLQLKYKGSFKSGYLSIYNSENLIEAEVDISCSLHNEHQLLCKLLKDLKNVKSLTLFSHNLEVLNINGGISLRTPLNNLKHLAVKLRKVNKEALGLVFLLRSSPYLENLSLSIDFDTFMLPDNEMLSQVYNINEEIIEKRHLLPPEWIAHLTKIRIENFQGLKVEMKFVELFLRSSLCLKEMVICISSKYRLLKLVKGKEVSKILKKKKAKIIERLLAYKRASPDAQILLK